MPRPTLFDHPKFLRLAHILCLPRPYTLGLLEYLWRVGYSSGNPTIGDEVDVELACEWTGEKGKLAAALLEVRFIDRLKNGKLQIHNLHENAPDYVKSRFRMERYRKRTRTKQLRNSYHSPAPAPAPAPLKETESGVPDSVCPETAEPSRGPPILTFPVVGKGAKEWHLLDGKLMEYRVAFPGLDILAECRAALQWCRDNPAKRKTSRGMAAFLTRWLTRAQNSGRASAIPEVDPETPEQKAERLRRESTAWKPDGPTVGIGSVLDRLKIQPREVDNDR